MSVVGAPSSSIDDSSSNRKKRTRKRKSRVRTDPEDQLSEQEQDEGEPSKKSFKTADEIDKDESGSIKSHRSDEEASSSKPKEKRKRKRTRGKGKKEEVNKESNDSTLKDPIESSVATSQPQSKISASMQKYLDDLGDPKEQSDKLYEKTINALVYARQYHLAKSEWKFNKAKQEYLIRHMLTPPPQSVQQSMDDISTSKQRDDEDNDAAAAAGDDDITTIPDQQHWSDEWNLCVAKYLATIQGKARERLFSTLTKAAEQIVPTMPAEVVAAKSSMETVRPSSSTPNEKKSVSFGDLAMTQDAMDTEAQDAYTSNISAADVQRLQFQKERAVKLLLALQD